jgi:glucan phosphoethanolaminetransferase (alkaline phosphatase superfamily)
VEYVDGVLGSLIEKAPVGTHFMIMADHGECFGENGYFGHGPIVHEKVLEVPFLEGRKK